MAIPDYQTLMLPLLKCANDHDRLSMKDAVQFLSDTFALSEEERVRTLDSGTQRIINNRIGWARTYLVKAGLLFSPERGYISISERGRDLLKRKPKIITNSILEEYPSFLEFRGKTSLPSDFRKCETNRYSNQTPEEELLSSFQTLKETLLLEILERVKTSPPLFFEELVVDTLVKMGYGGSKQEAGKAIGRSGDEGIDGIINEDKLGLDVIYIQAKRWAGVVGRPEIQKFAGALQGKRAKKGIFITTSDYSKEAIDYVKNIDSKIILLSGTQLVELMWEYEVGITTEATVSLKKIDLDYFGN